MNKQNKPIRQLTWSEIKTLRKERKMKENRHGNTVESILDNLQDALNSLESFLIETSKDKSIWPYKRLAILNNTSMIEMYIKRAISQLQRLDNIMAEKRDESE